MKRFNVLTIACMAMICLGQARADIFEVYEGDIIQVAVDQAGDHDAVWIHSGIYDQIVYFDADSTIYRGDGINYTIIEGTFYFDEGSGFGNTLSDMAFSGPNGEAMNFYRSGARLENLDISFKQEPAIFVGDDCNIEMSNCRMYYNVNGAIHCWVDPAGNFGSVTLNNCQLSENGLAALPRMSAVDRDQDFGGAVCLDSGGGHVRLVNSLLVDNWVLLSGGVFYAGNDDNIDSTIVDLFACTVIANDAWEGSVFWGRNGKARFNASNCLFYGNSNTNQAFHGNANFYACNVAWPNDHGISNCILQDPELCDLVGGNYQVSESSICLPNHNNCGVQIGAFGQGCDGVGVTTLSHPAKFYLMSHPNPFNPKTTINFNLEFADQISLNVYDLSGKLIATIVDGTMSSGPHSVVFDGSHLASGIYFCHLQAADQNITSKLMLLK